MDLFRNIDRIRMLTIQFCCLNLIFMEYKAQQVIGLDNLYPIENNLLLSMVQIQMFCRLLVVFLRAPFLGVFYFFFILTIIYATHLY